MKNAIAIFKRELGSYFTQPIAYTVLFLFLIKSMALNFSFGRFIRIGDASLEWSFFFWHPWVFMFLVPAVGMRLWSEEQRFGTIELLGTLPISPWSAIIGKYFAAALVWLIALILTFPLIITVNYLGEPDNGRIIASYLGSFMVACTFLAITLLVSACTRDQVVCLIISVAICVFMVLCGYDDIARELGRSLPSTLVDGVVSIGIWDHFRSLTRGLFRVQDLIWFISVITVCLLGTNFILKAKRS